nr:hypothetical protein [Mycoplasmopsis bovis]
MKKWSKKTNIIGSLVALGSFPVIALSVPKAIMAMFLKMTVRK